eukprot:TRINITY_DN10980_c0_g1_i1.p1 TRINITY_DN10980_c0_g1~~TRINITY_DN10980_c0_g1_i1.p1  ORF type:complete len:119 (-),score=1.24 TRINITY_DN10980_c0_g1_i1:459-815(-)
MNGPVKLGSSSGRPRRPGCATTLVAGGAALFAGSSVINLASKAFKSHIFRRQVASAPTCQACTGDGSVRCDVCSGRKAVQWRDDARPDVQHTVVCPVCQGKGSRQCPNCFGYGRALQT